MKEAWEYHSDADKLKNAKIDQWVEFEKNFRGEFQIAEARDGQPYICLTYYIFEGRKTKRNGQIEIDVRERSIHSPAIFRRHLLLKHKRPDLMPLMDILHTAAKELVPFVQSIYEKKRKK